MCLLVNACAREVGSRILLNLLNWLQAVVAYNGYDELAGRLPIGVCFLSSDPAVPVKLCAIEGGQKLFDFCDVSFCGHCDSPEFIVFDEEPKNGHGLSDHRKGNTQHGTFERAGF